MEQEPKIESKPKENIESEKGIEIKPIEREKVEKLLEEYRKDPDRFYEKNRFLLWDGEKNPALLLTMEMLGEGVRKVFQEKEAEKCAKIVKDAKDVAMLVAKYLGADIDGWCKVSVEIAVKINGEITEKSKGDLKEQFSFITEKIKKSDPAFSELLSKLCVYDQKTGENRSIEEVSAMMEIVVWIAKTMYEQMKQDTGSNKN